MSNEIRNMPDERKLAIDAYIALINATLQAVWSGGAHTRYADALERRLIDNTVATLNDQTGSLTLFGVIGYPGGDRASTRLQNWKMKADQVRTRQANAA